MIKIVSTGLLYYIDDVANAWVSHSIKFDYFLRNILTPELICRKVYWSNSSIRC